MGDDNELGQLTVMQGVMASASDSVAGLPALPATRSLEGDELARVDEEEGLDGRYAVEHGGGGTSHSFAELAAMTVGLLAVAAVVWCFFPFARFFGTRVSEGGTYAAGVEVRAGKAKKSLKMVESLVRERRFNEAADRCWQELDALPADRETHREWEGVWAVYFEALGMLDRRAEIQRGLRKLAVVNPDSDSLVYYRVRGWLDEISHANAMSELSKSTRDNYLGILRDAGRNCGNRVSAAAQTERDFHFLLLLGEARLLEWLLLSRPTDVDGLVLFSSVVDTLRRLPEGDSRRVRLELRAWVEFRRTLVFPMSRYMVAGEIVDGRWVDARIAKLRAMFSGGRR